MLGLYLFIGNLSQSYGALATVWAGMCTRLSEPRPRRSKFCPRRDRDKMLQLPRRWPRPLSSRDSRKSRELQRLAETFSMTYGETNWQWHWHYGLIYSHHGKRFLFVMLWVFALYFDNYHWIINGLHHKELQLQCCRHEPLCLLQFASNWN